MLRLGIVGTGGMATQRCEAFAAAGAVVAGVTARNIERARRLADAHAAEAAPSLEALLPRVDAVVVCTPNQTHADIARQALRAGKHVLVEYPLCAGMEDAADLRALAASAGRVLMVGNTIRHEAMLAYLREHGARLGTVVSAASRVAFYSEGIAGHWYLRPAEVSPIFASFHYHHIEYYRHLLGEVAWVLAREESRPDPGRPGVNTFSGGTLLMGHAGGATSCVQWYLSAEGDGTARGLWLNGTRSSVSIFSQGENRSVALWNSGGAGNEDEFADNWGVAGSCRDFLDAVAGRLDHGARLEWDLRTLRVGILASESARTGAVAAVAERPE